MSLRAALAVGSACLAALIGASCSLVVGELDLRCTQPSDCDALNEKYGLDPSETCVIYQCRPDERGCEKRPQDLDGDKSFPAVCASEVEGDPDCDDSKDGGIASTPGKEEICDGRDNNCNGFVDEGLRLEPAYPREIEDQNVVHLAHTAAADGALYVALTSQDDDEFITNVWRYDTGALADDPMRAKLASSIEDPESLDCTDVQCTFVELALAAAPDLLLGLGVNKTGCRAGQIRVGGVGRNGTPASGTFLWIRPLSTCPALDSLEGASRTSLAILPQTSRSRQGLALWRAGRDDLAAPLAGTGLWIEAREEAPPAVQSTGAGAEQLARSEGYDAPAIAPWLGGADGGGYFVAYDAADTIEVAFIPRLAERSTTAMSGWQRAEPIAEPGARHVVLAADADTDPSRDRPRGLGAAWRTEAGEIRFARISFDPDASAPLTVETPMPLGSGATILEGPKIAYLARGIRSGNQPGGWFVTWIERDGRLTRLVGTRVPEAGDELKAPFTIYQGGELRHLFAYRANDSTPPGYGFIAAEGRERLYIGSLTCARQD